VFQVSSTGSHAGGNRHLRWRPRGSNDKLQTQVFHVPRTPGGSDFFEFHAQIAKNTPTSHSGFVVVYLEAQSYSHPVVTGCNGPWPSNADDSGLNWNVRTVADPFTWNVAAATVLCPVPSNTSYSTCVTGNPVGQPEYRRYRARVYSGVNSGGTNFLELRIDNAMIRKSAMIRKWVP
jgi:hypothetical protein